MSMLEIFQRHISGPMSVTRAFLPQLAQKQTRKVINITKSLGEVGLLPEADLDGSPGYWTTRKAQKLCKHCTRWCGYQEWHWLSPATLLLVTQTFAEAEGQDGYTFLALDPTASTKDTNDVIPNVLEVILSATRQANGKYFGLDGDEKLW